MRTKSMILGAALLAAGVASSMAQSNVYSLNVVGYINISLGQGLNLIANNLDLDGTGTNNLMTNVLNPLIAANNTSIAVYKWDTNTSGFDQWNYSTHGGGGWVNVTYPSSGASFTSATLNPGEGAFVDITIPGGTNLTVVGTVLQGSWTNSNLVPGNLSMASAIAPLANNIDSTGNGGLNFTIVPPCTVYVWDLPNQGFDTWVWSTHGGGGWSSNGISIGGAGSGPVINVGTGFFVESGLSSWTNTFNVQ